MCEYVFHFGNIEGIFTKTDYNTATNDPHTTVRIRIDSTRERNMYNPLMHDLSHGDSATRIRVALSYFLNKSYLAAGLDKLILRQRRRLAQSSVEARTIAWLLACIIPDKQQSSLSLELRDTDVVTSDATDILSLNQRIQKFENFTVKSCVFRYHNEDEGVSFRLRNDCHFSHVVSFFLMWLDDMTGDKIKRNWLQRGSIFASPILKDISLRVDTGSKLTDSDISVLAERLQNDWRNVVKLELLVERGGTFEGTSLTPLARELWNNKSLCVLDLNGAYLSPEDAEAFMILLAKHNSTLKKLENFTTCLDLFGNDFTTAQECLADYQEGWMGLNGYAQRLLLDCQEGGRTEFEKYKRRVDRIHFFLKLNKYGRKHDATASFLAKTIIEHKEDTAVVFFYLSKNPLILKQASKTAKIADGSWTLNAVEKSRYAKEQGMRQSVRKWMRGLMLKLHHLAWNQWDHRSQHKQKPNDKKALKILDKAIVSHMTSQHDSVMHSDRHHFRHNLISLLKKPLHYKQDWLSNVVAAKQCHQRILQQDDNLKAISRADSHILHFFKCGHFRMMKPPRSRSTEDQTQSNAAPST